MKYFFIIFITLFSSPAFAEEKECDSFDTEFKMYDCIVSEHKEKEKLMMKTYKQALFELQERKAHQRKKILIDSQQHWLSYRETSCMAESYDVTDQQDRPLLLRLCHMRLAERRTEDIQEHFKTWIKN